MPLQPFPMAEDDVDLSQVSSFLRRHQRLIATCCAIGLILSIAATFVLPLSYTSEASFMPQGQNRLSSLASLASQFGVSVPPVDAGRSPGFYATLLVSNNLLADLVQHRFVTTDRKSVSLVDYLRAGGDTPDRRLLAAIEKLKRKVGVSIDQKAGLVRVAVSLHDPVVSRDVANALIAEVDSFNLKSRQSQASAERKFTERRLAEAQADARQAQDELQAFLQRNRDFRASPQLSFQYDRLADNVSLRQQLYTSVAQAYEQARIEEVRDTPVITLVEAPMLPARPDSRPFGRMIAAGLVLSLIAARIIAVRRDHRTAAEA
jgi:uncharacterized protein involved in exopolysaccharide biosynthesis